MKVLRQGTAATVKVGPFVDDTDAKTPETALTIQKADVRLSKQGGDIAAASADQGVGNAGAPHDELGYYDVSLDATDTATVGRLRLIVQKSGALPVWEDWTVYPQPVYDALIAGTGNLRVVDGSGNAIATATAVAGLAVPLDAEATQAAAEAAIAAAVAAGVIPSDADVSAIGGGSGPVAVPLYVRDGDGNPVSGLHVGIATVGSQWSAPTTGLVTFHLEDDTEYQVTIADQLGYQGDTYALTIAGGVVTAPAGGVLTVTALTVPAPADPAYCTVYAWVIGQGGQYPTGTLEVVRVVSPADTEAGQTVVLEDDSAAISAANGYCALTILRGAVVDLRLADADGNTLQARSRRLVPDAATANWVDLVAV